MFTQKYIYFSLFPRVLEIINYAQAYKVIISKI